MKVIIIIFMLSLFSCYDSTNLIRAKNVESELLLASIPIKFASDHYDYNIKFSPFITYNTNQHSVTQNNKINDSSKITTHTPAINYGLNVELTRDYGHTNFGILRGQYNNTKFEMFQFGVGAHRVFDTFKNKIGVSMDYFVSNNETQNSNFFESPLIIYPETFSSSYTTFGFSVNTLTNKPSGYDYLFGFYHGNQTIVGSNYIYASSKSPFNVLRFALSYKQNSHSRFFLNFDFLDYSALHLSTFKINITYDLNLRGEDMGYF